eukprot:PhF_6_TR20774/c0_g1_i2/m.29817
MRLRPSTLLGVVVVFYVVFFWYEPPTDYSDLEPTSPEPTFFVNFELKPTETPSLTRYPVPEKASRPEFGLAVVNDTLYSYPALLWGDDAVPISRLVPATHAEESAYIFEILAKEKGIVRCVILVGLEGEKPFDPVRMVLSRNDTLLIVIDPHQSAVKKVLRESQNYVMYIPGTVAKENSHNTWYLSENDACSSLQLMNEDAIHHYTKKYQDEVYRHRKTTPSPHKLRTIGEYIKCASYNHEVKRVGTFPLSDVLKYIPKNVFLDFVVTRTPGYDYLAVSTLNKDDRSRAGRVVVTCQDTHRESPLLFWSNTTTCFQVDTCFVKKWKWRRDACFVVNRETAETVCVYVNPLSMKAQLSESLVQERETLMGLMDHEPGTLLTHELFRELNVTC